MYTTDFNANPQIITTPVWGYDTQLLRPSINSLAPGRCSRNFKSEILRFILWNYDQTISCKTVIRGMLHNFTDDKSTMVQVMAWCHQTASHYLSQCWPRSMPPYGVTMPQWVNMAALVYDIAKHIYRKCLFHSISCEHNSLLFTWKELSTGFKAMTWQWIGYYKHWTTGPQSIQKSCPTPNEMFSAVYRGLSEGE